MLVSALSKNIGRNQLLEEIQFSLLNPKNKFSLQLVLQVEDNLDMKAKWRSIIKGAGDGISPSWSYSFDRETNSLYKFID
jgi:hypothetical protein